MSDKELERREALINDILEDYKNEELSSDIADDVEELESDAIESYRERHLQDDIQEGVDELIGQALDDKRQELSGLTTTELEDLASAKE